MRIKKIAQTPGLVATVVDNLNSDSDKNALSARQGKQLKKMIDDIEISGGSGGGSGTTTIINDALPIGSIVPYTSSTIPDNWFVCEGQAISRTEYSELFEVLGTTYGAGDGSTTFNLPNLKGRVPVGRDSADSDFDTLGKTDGEKNVKLEPNNYSYQVYSTNQNYSGNDLSTLWNPPAGSWGLGSNYITNNNVPHNNLQPYIILNYIIKAKQTKTSGGIGTPEIAIGPDEPTGEEVLWIEDEEDLDEEDLDITHLLEKTTGVVLYDNYIGSIEDITLSESAMNFEYIEVFGNRGNRSFSVRVRTNSTYFVLNHMRFVNDLVYTYIKEVQIQDNILHPMYSKLIYGGSASDDAATLITKVVGFNRYNSKVMKFYVMTDSSTYDNISFNFDNGMTWEEFTNSSYNTDNTFKINNSQVESTANSKYHLAYYTSGNSGGYDYVTYNSVIDPNKTYFWGNDK